MPLGDACVDDGGQNLVHETGNLFLQVITVQNTATVLVDCLALAVEHVVILEHILTLLSITALNVRLCGSNSAANNLGVQRGVLGGCRHEAGCHAGVEQAHQLVGQRQVEAGLTRVTLTAGTTAQLVVDTAGLVTLGTEHVQTTELGDFLVLCFCGFLALLEHLGPACLVFLGVGVRVQAELTHLLDGLEFGVTAEHDVGTATSHVGCHGDGALTARLRNDSCLALVVLRVQHLVAHTRLRQLAGQVLGVLHAGGTDQNRLALLVAFLNVLDHCLELGDFVAVHLIGVIDALHALVGGNRHDTQVVGVHELGGLGLCGTRHARKLVVHAEVVLQGHGRHGLVLRLDFDAFLRLNRLVDAVVVAAARQNTTGVLVHNQNLAVDDHVVLVVGEQLLRLNGVVQEANQRSVLGFVEVLHAQVVFHLIDTGLEDADGALLLVHLVVFITLEHRCGDARKLCVPAVCLAGSGAGNDQRGTRLINQNGVDLIDNGEVVATLNLFLHGPGHVVTQVVEAELVVRTIGDVRGVLLTTLVRLHGGQNHAALHTEEAEHAAHEVRLVLGQIVVHGHDVHALAAQSVQVCGQGRDEGFALTGLHFGNVTQVQCCAAHNLDVVVTLAQGTLGCFANHREGLRQQDVEGLAVLDALTELIGFRSQLLIGHGCEAVLERVHRLRVRLELSQNPLIAGSEDFLQERCH